MDQASSAAASRPFSVTNRSVLAIAVPMTLAYLTTPLLGLVDTAVVGQFGDAALLGGLAAGALAFDVVFTTFNFLRSGTTGLVAQAWGRGGAAPGPRRGLGGGGVSRGGPGGGWAPPPPR
ncbi:MATE family efflux transporter, partial [Mesorhizobium retamae]